ncbi:hypothetical protein [Streptantibioticus ferralitis]|uniref:Uncharacterized protein n=1 Tax=Streptantibioticus ferralitis TaxID=236510 RepID=A0ABT5ZAM7_9ACTN|nr:hypothetical protein [Streptantibioticus ferralitis]MDF2260900.1 hypothetical protein [Streptantibioticus ferralitis]
MASVWVATNTTQEGTFALVRDCEIRSLRMDGSKLRTLTAMTADPEGPRTALVYAPETDVPYRGIETAPPLPPCFHLELIHHLDSARNLVANDPEGPVLIIRAGLEDGEWKWRTYTYDTFHAHMTMEAITTAEQG